MELTVLGITPRRAQILAKKVSARAFTEVPGKKGDKEGEVGIEGTTIQSADSVRCGPVLAPSPPVQPWSDRGHRHSHLRGSVGGEVCLYVATFKEPYCYTVMALPPRLPIGVAHTRAPGLCTAMSGQASIRLHIQLDMIPGYKAVLSAASPPNKELPRSLLPSLLLSQAVGRLNAHVALTTGLHKYMCAFPGHAKPAGAEADVLWADDPLPRACKLLHRHVPLLQGHLRGACACPMRDA